MKTPLDLRLPARVLIGPGEIKQLGSIVAALGTHVLLVTGTSFLQRSGLLARVEDDLQRHGISTIRFSASGEPDVDTVDDAARQGREARCEVVIAVGGGSALDLGKSAAGMIPNEGSIRDYLEGVGTGAVMKRNPVPFIAAPTTAGTGSEATRNAVIGSRAEGFKKSFRDPRLVPDAVIVDPELTTGCPAELTASTGMDALTQLLESLTSLKASPMMDALALSGLQAAGPALPRAVEHGSDVDARSAMAYASFLSGVTLSHAGLGVVHGLASPLGALFSIPHSVICARLLPFVTTANLKALKAGRGFAQARSAYQEAEGALGQDLHSFCARFSFPPLSSFGVTGADIPRVVKGATGGSMKTNPVELTNEELQDILHRAL